MDTILSNLQSAFKNYITRVDEFYKESTKDYSDFFGNEASDLFCRGISHIIRQFLESDENIELFIQLPVDELASKPNLQKENFQKLQDVICHTLAMAVYPEGEIEAPELTATSIGELYYTADDISCKNGETRPRLWKITQGNTFKYPIEQYPDTVQRLGHRNSLTLGRPNELRDIFNEHVNNTFRLHSLPPTNNRKTWEKLSYMAKMLKIYKAQKTNKHYKNALFVGYGGSPSSSMPRICDITYLDYPVKFAKEYDGSINEHYEIIVIVGDNKYNKGAEYLINNEFARGECRKVIYIGSNRPANFNGVTFSFSNRELYHYFANDKFPVFKIDNLSWDSLEKIVGELNEILNNGTLQIQNDIIKRAITFTLTPYLGYTFFKDSDPLDERLLDFLNDNLPLTDEQWQLLQEKTGNLAQLEAKNNPKKERYEQIRRKCGNNPCILLESYHSYKNKIKETCKKNIRKNTYVIDVCSDSNCYIDVVKCLFQKLAIGNVHLLSYFNLNKIRELLIGEYKLYNDPYRRTALNDIEYTRIQDSTPTTYGTLDSFEINIIDDYFLTSYEGRNTTQKYYTLTTEDGTQYEVCGDVIRSKQVVNISDVDEYSEDWLPCELSFYVKPSCFQQLRDILYDLPQGEDINTYAVLWKSRLQERCENNYGWDYKKMWEEDNFKGIKISNFKNYVNGKYNHMFPGLFSRLALRMKALNLLTDKEFENSLKAHTASKKSRSIGSVIKKGLYDFILTGRCELADLNVICSNSKHWPTQYSIEKLVQLSIVTANVVKINKSKKEHNDDE